MTVSKVTSGVALTSVAVLEAAPEVAKTNRFYNRFTNTGLQAFSSMHILEGRGLRDAIEMTYSDGKSRFCRPFDGVAPAQAWSPSSRPKSLLKIMHRSFAAQGCRPCMLGSHRFNGGGLPRCTGGVIGCGFPRLGRMS